MVKIQKETVTKRYRDECVYEETIIQFHYDSEKEKYTHSREMQLKGFEDNGQVRENVGDMLHPEYVWFGSYYKHVKVEENVLPDMREKVKEYISELDAEIDRCHKKMEELSYDEICRRANKIEINYYFARREALAQVKNDLQGRLGELI